VTELAEAITVTITVWRCCGTDYVCYSEGSKSLLLN